MSLPARFWLYAASATVGSRIGGAPWWGAAVIGLVVSAVVVAFLVRSEARK